MRNRAIILQHPTLETYKTDIKRTQSIKIRLFAKKSAMLIYSINQQGSHYLSAEFSKRNEFAENVRKIFQWINNHPRA